MLYVYEDPTWEYKFIARSARDEWRISGAELTALGAEGWELVGIANPPNEVHFYFKRLRK